MLRRFECLGQFQFDATNAADVERFASPPQGATHLVYASFVTVTSAGAEVAIHNELSWVDADVLIADADTTTKKIVINRDRGGIAEIDAWHYAGLSGMGEAIPPSLEADPPCRLYVFIAGTELPSGASAKVRGMWGRLAD